MTEKKTETSCEDSHDTCKLDKSGCYFLPFKTTGMYYLLDKDKKPYKVTLKESYKLYDDRDMKITKQDKVGDVRVSTVFLGLDHAWIGEPSPILWETMIFGGEHDQYQERYTSHEDALAGHQRAIDLVKNIEREDESDSTVSVHTP